MSEHTNPSAGTVFSPGGQRQADAPSESATTKTVFFSLLRYEMTGEPPEKTAFDPKHLYRLAKRHDMGHLVADALKKNQMLPADEALCARFMRRFKAAVYRTTKIEHALPKITAALNDAAIPYILLKGTRLRSLYPEFWMRTSCDIDVLVHDEHLDKAVDLLSAAGFSTDGLRREHDVAFDGQDVHVELHYTVCLNNPAFDAVLSQIWAYAAPFRGFEYQESSAFFVFYHTAHMAQHFMDGGCGIRPVLDLWLLRKNAFYDEAALLPLLDKAGLFTFYQTMCALSDAWFGGDDPSALPPLLEEYIFSGGVYGTLKNNYVMSSIKSQGKLRHLLESAFPPVSSMKRLYPTLEKRRLLLPLFYVHRLCSRWSAQGTTYVFKKAHTMAALDNEKIRGIEALLQSLGLGG